MGTYITLSNWTADGLKNVRATVDRLDAGVELAARYGVTEKQMYWTLGPYDMVFVGEAADDESYSAYLLDVSSRGAINTTTLRAYDREEMRRLLARLG